jgi:hypothetical protein
LAFAYKTEASSHFFMLFYIVTIISTVILAFGVCFASTKAKSFAAFS